MVNIPYTGAYKSGAPEQFSKCGGRSTSFEVLLGGVVGLWTLKMVYVVSIQCFLIQLQPREDKGDREGIPHTHPIP